MKLLRRLLAAVLVLPFTAVAIAASPEVGEVAGRLDKHLESLDGTPLELETLRGKPVVIYFGGDWCAPCARTRPYVIKDGKRYASQATFVFVSMDDNAKRPAKIEEERTIAPVRIAMPSLARCPPGSCQTGIQNLGRFGRVDRFPTAVILDREGKVVWRSVRGSEIREQLATELSKLL